LWSDQDADSKEDEKQDSDVDGGNKMEAENSDSLSEAQIPNMDPVGKSMFHCTRFRGCCYEPNPERAV